MNYLCRGDSRILSGHTALCLGVSVNFHSHEILPPSLAEREDNYQLSIINYQFYQGLPTKVKAAQ